MSLESIRHGAMRVERVRAAQSSKMRVLEYDPSQQMLPMSFELRLTMLENLVASIASTLTGTEVRPGTVQVAPARAPTFAPPVPPPDAFTRAAQDDSGTDAGELVRQHLERRGMPVPEQLTPLRVIGGTGWSPVPDGWQPGQPVPTPLSAAPPPQPGVPPPVPAPEAPPSQAVLAEAFRMLERWGMPVPLSAAPPPQPVVAPPPARPRKRKAAAA